MKKHNIFISILVILSPYFLYTRNSITSLRSGRLGDSVLILSKTLLFAKKYGLEFLYTPLPGLEHLAIDTTEKKYTEQKQKEFKRRKHITTSKEFTNHLIANDNILYVTTIHSNLDIESPLWPINTRNDYKHDYPAEGIFEYAVEHPEFLQKLKKLLTPIKKINKLTLPADKITIAIHVRHPSGTDSQLLSIQQYDNPIENNESTKERIIYADKIWPLKFPPDQYYINQIKKLSHLLGNSPLYVHIFTDDKNPDALMHRYKKALNMNNISFGCVQKNGDMIDDLFNMMDFDCIIASLSHFAWTAQLLGNHKIIINPIGWQWHGQILHIDQTKIMLPDREFHKVVQYRFDGDVLHLRDQVLAALAM
ncbi:hypothetical protein HRU45_00420 [Candidatus Dependentiae bacterium]|nr:hypothetical protein [Candidatus Dependentiae bacterium]